MEEAPTGVARRHKSPGVQAQQRVERQEAAWAAARPGHAASLVTWSEQHAAFGEERRLLLQGLAQRRADAALSRLKREHCTCSPSCAGQFSEHAQLLPVYGLSFRGKISITSATCSCCSQLLTPCPIEAGFFPSSPVDAQAWYDLELISAHSSLSQRGLSSTRFMEFVTELSGVADGPVDNGRRPFLNAAYALERASHGIDSFEALGVEGMDKGACQDCPICAHVPSSGGAGPDPQPGAEEAQLPVVPVGAEAAGAEQHAAPWRLAVAMDGNCKLNRYRSSGSAGRNVAPQIAGGYFGKADAQAHAMHAMASNGKLRIEDAMCMAAAACHRAAGGGNAPLAATAPAGAAAGDDDDLAHSATCASTLTCSRPEGVAANSSPCDVHGVVGTVCMHGVPLRGGFLDMETPECFSHYILLLTNLVLERADIGDVYIDFGCRFKKTWKRFVEQHPELPAQAADLRILVNWLHGAGHDLACEVSNSGRYTKDAGRRIGEEAEQMWSLTKPVADNARYMSKSRRRDHLERVLSRIARRKLSSAPRLLKKKWEDTLKLIRLFRIRLANLEAAARADGVHDLHTAAMDFERTVAGGAAEPAEEDVWQSEHVRALLHYRGLTEAATTASSLAAVSAASAATLVTASSSAAIAKAEARLASLERLHGLPAVDRAQWQPGHHDYDIGLAALKTREVCRCRRRISTLVLQVQQLQRERAQAGSGGQVASRIRAKGQRRRGQVRVLLTEMCVWQSLGTADKPSSFALSEEEAKQLYVPGRLAPWETVTDPAQAQTHHGQLYHAAMADMARAEEELGILQQERMRLQRWVQLASQQGLAALERHVGAGRAGAAHLLRKRMDVVALMRAEMGAWAAW